jgi:hypothetical protein
MVSAGTAGREPKEETDMPDKQDNKDVRKNDIPADAAGRLSDGEMEDVSGGLLGITIVDTCPKKYDYSHCCNNFGRCPNLVIVSEDVQFDVVNFQRIHRYVFSCAKGYYSNVSDTETRDIR